MRKYKQIIRLKKWNLDIARRELAELESLRDELVGKINAVERTLVQEQIVASHGGFLADYGIFAEAEIARRDRMNVSLREIEGRIAEKAEHIRAAFQDLKTVEIAADRAAQRELYRQRRAEQATLDDIAGQRAHRIKPAGMGGR